MEGFGMSQVKLPGVINRRGQEKCIKSEARLKVKYEKMEEQGRELEELLQDIRTRNVTFFLEKLKRNGLME
ncbi:hypothetical protein H5410_051618 [Solanum commersonii]|uniref:Uncharacterized protein n=1 Tax=Solanum commersonii TaxID=4109 RepID=A0A9J5X011_SOLCO|nr:hypothetical protein H5410_051618 [Solanum commersonii]